MTDIHPTFAESWKNSHARAVIVRFLPVLISAVFAGGAAYWAIVVSNLRVEVMVYQLKEAEIPLLLGTIAEVQKARDIRIGSLASRLYRIENILMSGVTDGELGISPDSCSASDDPGLCFIENSNKEFVRSGEPSDEGRRFRQAIVDVDKGELTELLAKAFEKIGELSVDYMERIGDSENWNAQDMRDYILHEYRKQQVLEDLEQEMTGSNKED